VCVCVCVCVCLLRAQISAVVWIGFDKAPSNRPDWPVPNRHGAGTALAVVLQSRGPEERQVQCRVRSCLGGTVLKKATRSNTGGHCE